MGYIKPINFGKDSLFWMNDIDGNKMFIDCSKKYLEDMYNTKGYVYLSEIYDSFGVVWDPEDENIVWIKKRGDRLSFIIMHQAGDSNWYIYPKKN